MDRAPILFVRLAPWADDEDDDLPRRGYGFRAGMIEQEMRDSTRAWWVLSAAREAQMHFIAAVAEGYVVGIWRIVDGSWRTIDGRRLGKSPRRWAREVADAPDDMWARVVGQRTPDRPDGSPLFGTGSVVALPHPWPEPVHKHQAQRDAQGRAPERVDGERVDHHDGIAATRRGSCHPA